MEQEAVTTEITSEDYILSSPEEESVSDIPEVTEVVQTADPELLQSVKNIESLMGYQFGLTIVIIAVFLSSVIIKSFFKGV